MVSKFYKDNFKSMQNSGAYPTDSNSGVIYRDPKGNIISKDEWLKRADEQFKQPKKNN